MSRSLADTVRIREQLNFIGIRLIAVSQGIDSDDEQADVMLTVHGLVDSLYIKELAKKIHRGLEGLALAGFHTGGKCFGYRSVKVDDRVRLEIDEEEAEVVRRIFEMSASGISLKKITAALNVEGVAPPRGSKQRARPSWVYTAIREMLRRELYIGKIVWNKRKFKKRPGTNKRISELRPENEWVVAEDPGLRIVSQELWDRVQRRILVLFHCTLRRILSVAWVHLRVSYLCQLVSRCCINIMLTNRNPCLSAIIFPTLGHYLLQLRP